MLGKSIRILKSGITKETGTGLGLLICHEFINKHHQEIWVESELNKGAVVSFSLDYKK